MILGGVVAICALTMKMDLLGYDSYFPAYDNLQGVVINVSNLSYTEQLCNVEKKEDGILSLRLNNKNYSLKFNPNQLSAMIEEVEHNDASIKNMWGKVYRIKLQINSQELHNRVTYSLSEIPNNKI